MSFEATKKSFGMTTLGEASLYTICNEKGMKAELTDYGARVVCLFVPDRDGNMVDVVLGHASAEEYEEDRGCFFGTTVGRNANRIANAAFTLDGVTYQLEKNDGENNLHSGKDSFAYKLWQVKEQTANAITFSIFSPDLEQGFPGNANVEVTYTVTEDNGLAISYYAVADKKTTFNMTNHTYFNLNGETSGSIYSHYLTLMASCFTPGSAAAIPSGELAPVEGTPFDFRTAKQIGQDIEKDDEQLINGSGYDHNFVLDKKTEGGRELEVAAVACAKESGIVMETMTDLPGMQFYSGNYIGGYTGKHGNVYKKREGFCLETQYFPDSINNPNFKASVSEAGEAYQTTTVYRFSVCQN